MTHSIYTCLWFSIPANEAAAYYCSVFKNSRLLQANPLVANFEINSTHIMALSGNEHQPFTSATSLVVPCNNQDEIDYYWNALGEGGAWGQCGWLTDKWGVSWQIIPARLGEWMQDPAKRQRVMTALLQMNKLEIEPLMNA